MSKFSSILHSINKYKIRFHKFSIFKGLFIAITLISILYLVLVIINYFLYLETSIKAILFWFYSVISIIIFSNFVLINFFKLIGLLKPISLHHAVKNISYSLPQIHDKLINTLELSSLKNNSLLINASIEQKSEELLKFNFAQIIDYKDIFKYLKYLLIPFFITLILLLVNFKIIKEGNARFVNYNVYYSPEKLFDFKLLNKNNFIKSGDDVDIKVKVEGKALPSNVFIHIGNNKIPMILLDSNIYTYTIKSLSNDIKFQFSANNILSEQYIFYVKQNPIIQKIQFEIQPPQYTNIKPILINTFSDLVIPYKSNVLIKVFCSNTDTASILLDSLLYNLTKSSNYFYQKLVISKTTNLKISIKNSDFSNLVYNRKINIVPDIFPTIYVTSISDTIVKPLHYFKGSITDDYGFHSLSFNYKIISSSKKEILNKQIILQINKNANNQEFYFSFNFSDLELPPNYSVEYYFEVKDNDPFFPNKSSKSIKYLYSIPSLASIDSTYNQTKNAISQQFDNYNQNTKDLQLDLNKFQMKLSNDNVSEWEKKQFLNNLIQKQNELYKITDSIKHNNQKNIENLKQLNKNNQDLLNKYEQIQKLLESILNDDIKKLIDSLQKMQSKFDQQKFDEFIKNYPENYKKINNDVNRSKELLERLNIEQKLQNITDQIKQLSNESKNLSESIKNDSKIDQNKKDSILNNEFEFNKLMQEYQELLEQNKEISKPFSLDSLSNENSEIQKEYNETKQQMNKNNSKNTSKQLNELSKKLDELSDKISNSIQQNNQESTQEDESQILQILQNLINFSFEQEKLLKLNTEKFSFFSNKYNDIFTQQIVLQNNFKLISDSIYSLASRNPIISKNLTDEVSIINQNLKTVLQSLKQFNKPNSIISQQKIITSTNKLALMLQESLEQSQQSMSMSSKGKQSKKKSKMPSIGDLHQMQQKLQQELQEMIESNQKGNKPNSEQVGQQLGNREQFQKMLQDYMNSENLSQDEQGMIKDALNLNEQIKKDLINNSLSNNTLLRDKKINSRLLESQNAENQRKLSKERQSNTSLDIYHSISDSIINIYFNKNKQKDVLNLNNIQLINFYNNYYYEYIYRIKH